MAGWDWGGGCQGNRAGDVIVGEEGVDYMPHDRSEQEKVQGYSDGIAQVLVLESGPDSSRQKWYVEENESSGQTENHVARSFPSQSPEEQKDNSETF